jgi:hypothetical protein
MRKNEELDGDRFRSDWDAFAGPARLMPDDRALPAYLLPMMTAAQGMRLAAEFNVRMLERFGRRT